MYNVSKGLQLALKRCDTRHKKKEKKKKGKKRSQADRSQLGSLWNPAGCRRLQRCLINSAPLAAPVFLSVRRCCITCSTCKQGRPVFPVCRLARHPPPARPPEGETKPRQRAFAAPRLTCRRRRGGKKEVGTAVLSQALCVFGGGSFAVGRKVVPPPPSTPRFPGGTTRRPPAPPDSTSLSLLPHPSQCHIQHSVHQANTHTAPAVRARDVLHKTCLLLVYSAAKIRPSLQSEASSPRQRLSKHHRPPSKH